jgi:hypothetical protein
VVPIVLLVVAAGVFSVAGSPLANASATIGSWTSTIQVGVIGVHAALLNTGKVLLYEFDANNGVGSKAVLFDPATSTSSRVDVPFRRNIICSGISLLADGRVLTTGGEPYTAGGNDAFQGIRESTIFDPATNRWTDPGVMAYPRWYPSNVLLPNGSTLVFSGRDAAGTRNIAQVERYDPATGRWTTLPAAANRQTGLYPRTVVLPDGRILVTRSLNGVTDTFDPRTNAWKQIDTMNAGQRQDGSVVLLPGLQRYLSVGGKTKTAVTKTAEILDMSAANPQWTYTGAMAFARRNPNLVLLADGTVLAVGGGTTVGPSGATKTAELYDPATGRWRQMAAQTAARTYHSTALLLPDGRVLSAGATSGLPEQTTVDIYSPPYLFKGPRPTISSVPGSAGYGQQLAISTPDASRISRVALIRPGAVTHSVNFDQRYVDLTFTRGSGTLTAAIPSSANTAPPGWYLVVIVDTQGIPSVGKFLRLS